MSRGTKCFARLASAACLVWSAAPLGADWLLLQDGARLEVQGGWKVSGRQVVFTGPDGRLSSLRADQIDLAASARSTAAPAPPDPTPLEGSPLKEDRPKAHWSLTDKDFARPIPATEEVSAAAPEPGPPAGNAAPALDVSSGLQVVIWSHAIDPASRRIQIAGTLQNGGSAVVPSIYLGVRLVDRQGQAIAEQSATVQKSSLNPGEVADFKVSFPEVAEFETAKFAPTPRCYKLPKNANGKTAAVAAGSQSGKIPAVKR